jgi:WD40 repeat protein
MAVLERRFSGHKHWVFSLAVSPDGTWAVTGGKEGTVTIWNLERGEGLTTVNIVPPEKTLSLRWLEAALHGPPEVKCVAIMPDGRRFLSGSKDDYIRIWDVAYGVCVGQWRASKHMVLSLAPLPDGRRVITSGAIGDPALKVWDVPSQQCTATLRGHTNAVTSVSVSIDGKTAVSGSYDESVRLWNLETGECLAKLQGHHWYVRCVKITPDGRSAFSGSDDSTVKVWDLEAGTCVGTLKGHEDGVNSVAVSPDGRYVASVGFADQTIRLWDPRSGMCLQVIRWTGSDHPRTAAFSPDGCRLIVAASEAAIFVYQVNVG